MAATPDMTEPGSKHEMMLQGQEHSQRFTEQLVILWEEKQFSDVVLKGNDNKEFPCHRVVLAAASSYFKAMFNSGMVESSSPTVELENMDSDILSSLIRYMYSGSLKITADNVQQLVESCKPLDFPEIIKACEDFIAQELCPTNCLGFRRFAELYELEDLEDASQSVMLEQFTDVVRSTEFGELSVQEITQYISQSNLGVKTEDSVFEAVCMWVRVDPVNREAQFPQIAAKVRFPHCSKGYLSSVVVPCLYMSNPECAAFLQEAWTYHMMPEQRSRVWSLRMVPREGFHCYSTFVVFGGANNEGAPYLYPEVGGKEETTKFFREDLIFYAVAGFQKGILVTGGQENGIAKRDCYWYNCKVHRWNYGIYGIPPMREGRSHHGCVVLAGDVYVLGGNLPSGAGSSVEVYNNTLGCWTAVVAMPKVLTSLLAISYGQYIFVTSGEGEEGQSVTTMVYDTVWDRWEYRKDMPKPVQYGSITAVKDKIYVVGGVLPSCLSYDMAVDVWSVLTPPYEAHGYAPSIASNGKIMVYGGKDATEEISGTVEIYNPKTDTWALDDRKFDARAYHHFLHVDMFM